MYFTLNPLNIICNIFHLCSYYHYNICCVLLIVQCVFINCIFDNQHFEKPDSVLWPVERNLRHLSNLQLVITRWIRFSISYNFFINNLSIILAFTITNGWIEWVLLKRGTENIVCDNVMRKGFQPWFSVYSKTIITS